MLLRNPTIKVDFYDPNPRANALLRGSLSTNKLRDRAQVFSAAINATGEPVNFDFSGSVIGHVSSEGTRVTATTVAEMFERLDETESILLKVDIEGFEVTVLEDLVIQCQSRGATLVLEVHPKGMNGVADPQQCWDILKKSDAQIQDCEFKPLENIPHDDFTNLVARWKTV